MTKQTYIYYHFYIQLLREFLVIDMNTILKDRCVKPSYLISIDNFKNWIFFFFSKDTNCMKECSLYKTIAIKLLVTPNITNDCKQHT